MSERSPKLLIDENLAVRLVSALASVYPGSIHVRDLGLAPASDRAIWQYAREHGLVIVTKDEDFHRLSVLHGGPPKVIWIRLGNCSTGDIIRLLAKGGAISKPLSRMARPCSLPLRETGAGRTARSPTGRNNGEDDARERTDRLSRLRSGGARCGL